MEIETTCISCGKKYMAKMPHVSILKKSGYIPMCDKCREEQFKKMLESYYGE